MGEKKKCEKKKIKNDDKKAKFVCKRCGLSSKKESHLCKPQKNN